MLFWQSSSFQNFSTKVNSYLESLHDLVMVWLITIILMVLIISYFILTKNTVVFLRLDSLTLEVTWTLIPMFILISIAVPSIYLLCSQDTVANSPHNSIKLTSNQWNWQSEYQMEQIDHLPDMNKLDELGNYETPLIMSFMKMNRVLLTSSDVLHSLGIPSLGVKLDSAPGRLNAILFEPMLMGLLPGSCYELCGSGHSAMPIYVFSA